MGQDFFAFAAPERVQHDCFQDLAGASLFDTLHNAASGGYCSFIQEIFCPVLKLPLSCLMRIGVGCSALWIEQMTGKKAAQVFTGHMTGLKYGLTKSVCFLSSAREKSNQ